MVDLIEVSSFDKNSNPKVSELSTVVLISAAAVTSSFLLIFIPNVETISLSIFLVGYLFKFKSAIQSYLAIVITWEFIASISYGFSFLVIPFKATGWFFFLLSGIACKKRKELSRIELIAIGMSLTLLWDLITTIPSAMIIGNDAKSFWSVYFSSLIFGVPFYAIHVFSNAYMFGMFPTIATPIKTTLRNKVPSMLI